MSVCIARSRLKFSLTSQLFRIIAAHWLSSRLRIMLWVKHKTWRINSDVLANQSYSKFPCESRSRQDSDWLLSCEKRFHYKWRKSEILRRTRWPFGSYIWYYWWQNKLFGQFKWTLLPVYPFDTIFRVSYTWSPSDWRFLSWNIIITKFTNFVQITHLADLLIVNKHKQIVSGPNIWLHSNWALIIFPHFLNFNDMQF